MSQERPKCESTASPETLRLETSIENTSFMARERLETSLKDLQSVLEDKCDVSISDIAYVINSLVKLSQEEQTEEIWHEVTFDMMSLLEFCMNFLSSTTEDNEHILLRRHLLLLCTLCEKSQRLSAVVFSRLARNLINMALRQSTTRALQMCLLETVEHILRRADNLPARSCLFQMSAQMKALSALVFYVNIEAQLTIFTILINAMASKTDASHKAILWFPQHPRIQETISRAFSSPYHEGSGHFLSAVYEVTGSTLNDKDEVQDASRVGRSSFILLDDPDVSDHEDMSIQERDSSARLESMAYEIVDSSDVSDNEEVTERKSSRVVGKTLEYGFVDDLIIVSDDEDMSIQERDSSARSESMGYEIVDSSDVSDNGEVTERKSSRVVGKTLEYGFVDDSIIVSDNKEMSIQKRDSSALLGSTGYEILDSSDVSDSGEVPERNGLRVVDKTLEYDVVDESDVSDNQKSKQKTLFTKYKGSSKLVRNPTLFELEMKNIRKPGFVSPYEAMCRKILGNDVDMGFVWT